MMQTGGRRPAGHSPAQALALVLALVLGLPTTGRCEDVVVVVSRDNANAVDLAYVTRIYEGALRAWPDGSPVQPLDQPEASSGRAAFSSGVLRRSVANMRALWSQNIFTGKGLPPKIVTEDDLLRTIAGNRRAIGYIAPSLVDDSVRVIGP